MDNREFTSTEVEQKQLDQGEAQTIPQAMPAATPEIKHDDEHIHSSQESGEAADAEVFPQLNNNLSYSCLLIPRFSDHYLTGDITEYLAEWMRQICVSYGWRLDAVIVRPGYIQWIMTVPPSANPAQFMRLTRRHTSERIFNEFPRFKQKNMSGDFWAPGYFIAAGNQLQSPETVSNFILTTRQHQGIA